VSVVLVTIFLQCTIGLARVRAATAVHIASAQTLSVPGYGFSVAPYETDDSLLPNGWTSVELPHALPRQLGPVASSADASLTPTVVDWYRLQVPGQTSSTERRSLYIARWKTDGQLAVYLNGKRLYMSHADVYWNGWNIPLLIPLDVPGDARSPSTLVLRIERPRFSGGGISSVWVEPDDSLHWRYRVRYLLQVGLPYASSAAFLAIGMFSFFVWCRLRSEPSYLLFFFLSVASFIRTLHYHVGEGKLPIPEAWFTWLTINSLFWMMLITHFFLNALHRRPQAWLNTTVKLVTMGVAVFTLPTFSSWLNAYALAPLTYLALIVIGSMVAGCGVHQSWRVRSTDGLLLSGWAVVGMLLGVHDWLLQNNYLSIEALYLGPYSNIGAFLICMYIIFRRYLQANESVRQSNASLTFRLKEREDELEQSHQRLREVEHRQILSRERQRLMQDMHDGMGSSLLTALLAAQKGRLDAAGLADVLKNCIDDLKLAIDSMEPVEADLLLLLATLRFRLAPRLESAGISLRWDIQNVPALDWLDPRNALHILRILQEAFSNIIKHTQATQIRLATSCDAEYVRVIITDNGQGFTVEQEAGHPGKGLSNQQRRAASIGAHIQLQSSAAGTCLTLVMPIKMEKRQGGVEPTLEQPPL
jgi:signal transduction histidine kinase